MGLQIVRQIREYSRPTRGPIGLVPTMGALHDGHAQLIRKASAECPTCIVSIFVNPTQFGPQEDFAKYPRMEEADLRLCESAGASIVFCPTPEEMYPRKTTHIHVEGVSELWEGAHRPGHFEGVATVVAKLFNILAPDLAFFGKKDLQQCSVLNRMVEDLDFRVDLRFIETIREPDGLAMSSRNAYLSPQDRAVAPLLYSTLQETVAQLRSKGEHSDPVDKILDQNKAKLIRAGFVVDYFALVRSEDLSPLSTWEKESHLIVAARLGQTRLIDNCST